MSRDDVTAVNDFSSMFSWIAGLSILGSGAAAIGGLGLVSKFRLSSSQDRDRKVVLLTAGAAIAPLVTSALGMVCVYFGVPGFQPRWGWQPSEKRSKTLAQERFSAKKVDERGPWDAIIIGSGMGGLSCGSVLAQLGYKVLVLEAHEIAGGSTHAYHVDGKTDYKFPSGLHYTIPASEEMLQAACGARRPPVLFGRMGDDSVERDGAYDRVKLTRTQDPVLRFITDIQVKKELRRRFPTLVPQIARVERIADTVLKAFPVWCALHAFPWNLRLGLMKVLLPSGWWRYAASTGEEVLEECFADAPASEKENVLKAQGYLCGLFLDAGCPPHEVSFFMLAATTLGFPHEGGAYPEHGTGEMAKVLVQRIESCGGAVFVRAPVAKIIVDEKTGRATGVKMIDEIGGMELHARHCVVSACGFRNTARLCKGTAFPSPDDMPLPQGGGWLMANIGIKGSAAELGLECANLQLLPAGKGMSIFDGCRAFFADPLGVPPIEIPMMVTFPTVKDRAYKHKDGHEEGRETAQLLVLTKTEWFGKIPEPAVGTITTPAWKHPVRLPDYEEIKEKWRDRLKSALFDVYPQLKETVELFDVSTPLTVEHYLPTTSGSGTGVEVHAGKSCRFTNFSVMKMLDMRTPVPGLWMTGQDTLLCGVPLAQASGLICGMRIAGPARAALFVLRTVWLLVASLGEKARLKARSPDHYSAVLEKMRVAHMPK